ncbi:hypothetical protein T06_11153 [Trichinella sp. T6]|nr:hypothetical protein T06_11153 [Trichinella sp. T6]
MTARDVLGRTLARERGMTVGQGKREMKELPLIKVPCTLVPVPLVQVKRVELHAFCDTSELAYGTVVYLRVETCAQRALVNLVTAKTRFAPIKRLTRLEHYPQAALDLQVHSTTYSSDSEVALAWVRSAANSEKPLGRNRPGRGCDEAGSGKPMVARSKMALGTAANMAAEAGRPRARPTDPTGGRTHVRKGTWALMTTEDPLHLDKAHCRRFTKNCRSPARERQGARELQDAEVMWVRLTQEEEFRAEIEALVRHGRVAAHSRISQFHPYMDECGVLRAWGGAFGEIRFVGVHAIPGNPPGESRVDRWINSPMSPAAATCRGGADTGLPPTTLLSP